MTTPGAQGLGAGPGTQPGLGPQQGPQLSPVTVEDIVQGDPVTAETDTPVPELVSTMAQEDVGSVIVTEDEEPVDIVTDRSIAMAVDDYDDLDEVQAEELIEGDVVTASEEDTVFDLLDTLSEQGIRRLPVVDEEGSLVGVVTLDDVIVLLGTEMANVGETIQTQIDRLG